MEDILLQYFPDLSSGQRDKILSMKPIYERWNRMINVISRKDMEYFFVHHVLHSLAIAKVISFVPRTCILDVGTGGGFPGVPLAIMFPDTEFFLLDSIGKKIKVVTEVARELELSNVIPVRKRAEEESGKYDFIVSRAVTNLTQFVKLTAKNISETSKNHLDNGILYLKGGPVEKEVESYTGRVRIWEIKEFFSEPFFETKKIVYLHD
jgi:16S rRNA (guanine527-N7)-methyltransferase